MRVERELGRRVRAELGSDTGYCIYSRSDAVFYEVNADAAHQIMAGKLQVDFEATADISSANVVSGALDDRSLKRTIRNSLIQHPRIYQLVQAARGHDFSIEYIQQMRFQEQAPRKADAALPPVVSTADVAIGRVHLTPDTTIISGGLDWEHKDIRAIYKLRRQFRFNYAAIVYDLIPLKYPHFVVPQYVSLLTEYFGELFWTANVFNVHI